MEIFAIPPTTSPTNSCFGVFEFTETFATPLTIRPEKYWLLGDLSFTRTFDMSRFFVFNFYFM
ncbi:MAG: hypothetical protein Q8R82_18190, partial [Hyphomonadaceae bacterium]|nr:hypothetical protein [Hyphomonadaceae bacterium]